MTFDVITPTRLEVERTAMTVPRPLCLPNHGFAQRIMPLLQSHTQRERERERERERSINHRHVHTDEVDDLTMELPG